MRSPRLRRLTARAAALALALGAAGSALPAGPAAAQTRPAAENSASRIIFWTTYCSTLAELSDRDLQRWADLGAGGFSCAIRQLAAWGGGVRFTDDPDLPALNDEDAPGYEQYGLQRTLRDSRIVERAKEHGLRVYLGLWTSSDLPGARTPFVDWFDDEAWDEQVIPQIREMAGAIRDLGFAGVTFDHENYPAHDNPQGVYWTTDYAGNDHSAAATRAEIRKRGRQIGRAITERFPGVEYAAYFTKLPVGWDAYHQYKTVGLNDTPACDSGGPTVDFWEGMAGARGYDALRFWEAVFFKPANSGSNFEAANQYNTGEIYSFLSRCWSKWRYASSRVQVSPFVWLDGVPDADDEFNGPYPTGQARDALTAFSKWGTGGEFANFAYALEGFDYGPYEAALQAASQPRVVDHDAPTIDVESPARGERTTTEASIHVAGTAHDDLMIRSVAWETDHGERGMAPMTWHAIAGGGDSEYFWTMNWEAPGVPVDGPTCITITATDIKGLQTARTVAVNGRDACATPAGD
jgi:hypothetical protein